MYLQDDILNFVLCTRAYYSATYNIYDGTSITTACAWWVSRDWTARGVDKNSWWYLRGTKRWIAARLIRHKEWAAGWTARTLGKSAAKSPAVAHLHEYSPPPEPRPRPEDVDPLVTTWRESDVFPSRRSTLPAWFEATIRPWTFLGPFVYLLLPLALPDSYPSVTLFAPP